uniref:F-box domain-containing protein n=1 Tax=Panagrellus redivivus TaxID=6233 RepID=A0A7E4VUS7_PANRE
MPYPLECLPYGLRQRLRDLCSPIEAYNIQNAVPYYYGLQPLIEKVDAEYLLYCQSDNIFKGQRCQEPINIHCKPAADMIFLTDDFRLRNCIDISNTIKIFANVSFSGEITLENCSITKELIDCVLDHLDPECNAVVRMLDIDGTVSSKLSANEICCMLPFPRSIRFSSFPFSQNWIDNDFKDTKCISFLEINAGIDFLDVDPTDFYYFFKAQHPEFNFFLTMENFEEPYSITKLQTFLSKHFENVPYPEDIVYEEGDWGHRCDYPSPCLHITVNFDEEFLYIPKNNTPKTSLCETSAPAIPLF